MKRIFLQLAMWLNNSKQNSSFCVFGNKCYVKVEFTDISLYFHGIWFLLDDLKMLRVQKKRVIYCSGKYDEKYDE